VLRSFIINSLDASKRVLSAAELDKKTVVFAPHQDDETLGCGGTVKLKRSRGVDVMVVFMTDGAAAGRQPQFDISGEALERIRNGEAIQACSHLGVTDVRFLSYPDGSLLAERVSATDRVEKILAEFKPEHIFIPYAKDLHPDHEATAEIVKSAVVRKGSKATIFEFPVWIKNQWPFVDQPLHSLRHIVRRIRALKLFLKEFRVAVDVRDVVEMKKKAIASHRSQMEGLNADEKWPTLGGVSNGEWLRSFLRNKEIFKSYEL